jgi:hypothetical protein
VSNGSQWSEIASILRQFTFSLFCKKLPKMWWFFVP